MRRVSEEYFQSKYFIIYVYLFVRKFCIPEINNAEVNVCMNISKDINKILIVVGSWRVVIVDSGFSAVFSYDNIIKNANNLNF